MRLSTKVGDRLSAIDQSSHDRPDGAGDGLRHDRPGQPLFFSGE
jgi:hypothetical protein